MIFITFVCLVLTAFLQVELVSEPKDVVIVVASDILIMTAAYASYVYRYGDDE